MNIRKFFQFFLIFAILESLVGCRSWRQTVEVPVYLHDTVRTVQVQHDSTYIDRWHTQYVKGDTVYVHDSIYESHVEWKHDTLKVVDEKPVEVPVVKEVEKPLSWWRKTEIYGFWALLALFVLGILWKFRKVIFKI